MEDEKKNIISWDGSVDVLVDWIGSWSLPFYLLPKMDGRCSSIRSVSAWHASAPPPPPPPPRSSIPMSMSGSFFHVDLVMKKLVAKECALSTGKLPRRLAQEQCGMVTDHAQNDLKCVQGP